LKSIFSVFADVQTLEDAGKKSFACFQTLTDADLKAFSCFLIKKN
jgi:hypothetical protein